MTTPVGPRVGDEADTEQETIHSGTKLFRLVDMVAEVHDELRRSPLDEPARARLRTMLDQTIEEFREVLSPDLLAELGRLESPLDAAPTTDELRVAYTELLGWLEGVLVTLRVTVRTD